MIVFLGMSIFMIVEFILERFNVYQVKEGIEDLENEIVKLKAKLYDQLQEGEEEDDEEGELDVEEEDEDDDDEDDDK